MPIYEYQCENCEHTLETIQKISEKPLRKCPECGKLALNKLISATAFRLKGDGWYETDFKSGSKRNVAGDKDGSSSSSSQSESGGSGANKTSDSQSKSKSDGKSSADAKSGSKNTASGKKSESKTKS